MNTDRIDTNIQELVEGFQKETFIYEFMRAYNFPKSTVTLLQKKKQQTNGADNEVLVKKKFLFKVLDKAALQSAMDDYQAMPKIKYAPRFIILTDYTTILAYDTKTAENLETTLKDLPKEFTFFLPLAGMEKTAYKDENPADVKAAEKMAKLFDEIKKQNLTEDAAEVHSLNVFLSRLLFCFFAEDTHIFEDNQFTNSIGSYTNEDGSDLSDYLTKLFEVLNLAKRPATLPKYLAAFPYVNGGLFKEVHSTPKFSRKARKILVECGSLDWAAINPDIFGSMIQAVVTPEHRGGLGMHYTSVPNIMKVIEPLFLNDLYEDFEKNKSKLKDLQKLLLRLSNLKIFDPACGSGNFLIIAYKALRQLEIKIFKAIGALKGTLGLGQLGFGTDFNSVISLSQFYGIELDDFAHEVASLSLWLAEHQMNTLFRKEFGHTKPALPLQDGGHIVQGNACRLDWEVVCPKEKGKEIYILGNPPYLGFNMQSPNQKEDIKSVFSDLNNLKFFDYITCWFIKATKYIGSRSKFAFVTTNSICQGNQVPILWTQIFKYNVEIFFSYREFTWSNNAKHKAGVICSIIGIREKSSESKYLYEEGTRQKVKNINAYLSDGGNTIVMKRQIPLSDFPKISTGNIPYDGGNLILSPLEKEELVSNYPSAQTFIKQLSGSKEYIRGLVRYCLWIEDNEVEIALSINPIAKKIQMVRESRLKGGKIAKNYAHVPHRFYMTNRAKKIQILIPRVSSIRRNYIPMGFLNSDVIISDSAQAIYDPPFYIFGIVNSRIHMMWVKTVAGRLKSDFRYSAIMCYNTFPFPKITETQKEELETHVYKVLEQREQHSEKTLAQLYDPNKMPEGLLAAHHELDVAVERCYRKAPFISDEERLAYLFKLYEKMIANEAAKNTLFAKAAKKRKQQKKS